MCALHPCLWLQSLPTADQSAAALRSQLQGRLLSSDMQAFKAANPGACLLGAWAVDCSA